MKKSQGSKFNVDWMMRCERCEIKVMKKTPWSTPLCPVCHGPLVVHVERKEVNDGQEKKPADP